MARYLKPLAAATLAILGLGASAPALAGGIQVTVATPRIVVAPPAVGLVAVHRVRPAPDLVWVAGTWRRDAVGHQIWVPGYWHNPRTGVVVHHRPAPAAVSRTVVIRR